MKFFKVAEMENLFYWLRTRECKYEMHFIDDNTIAVRKDSSCKWELKRISELIEGMHGYIAEEIRLLDDSDF